MKPIRHLILGTALTALFTLIYSSAQAKNIVADRKQILNDLNIKIDQGETHVLMGPNGAGKSTLGSTIMGDPRYKVSSGSVIFKGEDIARSERERQIEVPTRQCLSKTDYKQEIYGTNNTILVFYASIYDYIP